MRQSITLFVILNCAANLVVECQLKCSACQSTIHDRNPTDPQWLSNYENVSITETTLTAFDLANARPTCLDLSSNALDKWPKFVHSKHVRFLNLSSNRLTTWFFPKNSSRWAELLVLDLSYNRIAKFDHVAFKSLKNLQVLIFKQRPDFSLSPTTCLQYLRYLPKLKYFVTNERFFVKLKSKVNLNKAKFKVYFKGEPDEDNLKFDCYADTSRCYSKLPIQLDVANVCLECNACEWDMASAGVTTWMVTVSDATKHEPFYVAFGISFILLLIIGIICFKTIRNYCRIVFGKAVDFVDRLHAHRHRHTCMRSNNRLCSFVTHHKFCSNVACNTDSPLFTTSKRILQPDSCASISHLINQHSAEESEI